MTPEQLRAIRERHQSSDAVRSGLPEGWADWQATHDYAHRDRATLLAALDAERVKLAEVIDAGRHLEAIGGEWRRRYDQAAGALRALVPFTSGEGRRAAWEKAIVDAERAMADPPAPVAAAHDPHADPICTCGHVESDHRYACGATVESEDGGDERCDCQRFNLSAEAEERWAHTPAQPAPTCGVCHQPMDPTQRYGSPFTGELEGHKHCIGDEAERRRDGAAQPVAGLTVLAAAAKSANSLKIGLTDEEWEVIASVRIDPRGDYETVLADAAERLDRLVRGKVA